MSERVSEKTPARTIKSLFSDQENTHSDTSGKIQTCIIFITRFALAKVKRRHGAGEA